MNKMTEDEAIRTAKNFIDYFNKNKCDGNKANLCVLGEEINAIETILGELEKKDKIIELMIKHLCNVIDNDSDASLLPFYDSDDNLEEKVKEYFERKVENE